jgi:hypothetical protein
MSTYCTPALVEFARNQARAALLSGTFETPSPADEGFDDTLGGTVAMFESGNWHVVHNSVGNGDVTVLQWEDDYIAVGDLFGAFVVRFSWDQYAADAGMTNEGE